MSQVRVIAVDDEPVALSGLVALLARDPEIDIVARCTDGRAAIERIHELSPDVVFLDVQMPEIDGFQVIQQIGVDRMPVVVFVTAHDEFAIRAFEVSAVDYLLKPYSHERLVRSLERAKRASRSGLSDQLTRVLSSLHDREAPAQFTIREASRVYFVPMRLVDWIEGADYCVKLHVANKSHILRESLTSLAERLDPRRFFRIHRSAIVNLSRVREIRVAPNGDPVAVLHDGTRLKVARAKRAELERLLAIAEV
jgi:two-component system, LytTR family, response regulator